MKKIKLTRESVSMGDDIDLHHFLEIEIQQNWTILEILKIHFKIKLFTSNIWLEKLLGVLQ